MRSLTCFIIFSILFSLSFGACSGDHTKSQNEQFSRTEPVFDLNSVNDLYRFFDPKDNNYPIVSAHRGGPSPGYPENSLPTFARMAKSFPTIIECDVVMSKDSVLVLMHDETLDRTTNGSGAVKDKSFHELCTMRLKDTEGMLTDIGIPTLEEALLWGKDKTIFTLDIKRSVPYEKVIRLIRSTQTEANSVIITYSPAQAAIVNHLAPDLMISTTIRNPEDLTRLDDLGVPTNRLVAFVGTSEPDPTLYESLQERSIKSILGTMGNLDRSAKKSGYQRYADFVVRGASIISTDRPFEVQKALDFYINKREIRSPFIR